MAASSSSARTRAGAVNLFAQAADDSGDVTRLTKSPNIQHATSVSPDGTRLVFTETAPTTEFGRHAAPTGRHACGDIARADAAKRMRQMFRRVVGVNPVGLYEFQPLGLGQRSDIEARGTHELNRSLHRGQH